MTTSALRVAFFPDMYHEVDGVANTSRHYESFAARSGFPFLTVCGGSRNHLEDGPLLSRIERRRGRIGFALDKNHQFDLLFWRHYRAIEVAVRKFNPDIIHITGPSDVGQMGALLAHRLGIPLAASWHTNVHEYAEQRACRLLFFLPDALKRNLGHAIRQGSLRVTLRFYQVAQILFAPNQELIAMLEKGTGKPCYPMGRGVDTNLFHPQRRDRSDKNFVLGYVGRLSTEKNVRLLAGIERGLIQAGFSNFRFLIVGQGAEEAWLKANLQRADFTGVLRGEALAAAYANMDLFIFPSATDTYGNVVLEALASGVPAVVTNSGGPQFIVRPGETGYIAGGLEEFVAFIKKVAEHPDQLAAMRIASRDQAVHASWDRVFQSVYANYERELQRRLAGKKVRLRPPVHAASTSMG